MPLADYCIQYSDRCIACLQQEDALNHRFILGGFAVFLLTIVYLLWKHAGVLSLAFGTAIAVLVAVYVLLYMTCFARR